jgi:RimJ/RimL family protein N-acetyltransferase
MDMVVEARAPEGRVRRGWFGREEAPAALSLILECELGYTFDPAVWGQGYAGEAAQCVRDYARGGLGLGYVVSAIPPGNARSRRLVERAGARADGQMEAAGLTFDRWVWGL